MATRPTVEVDEAMRGQARSLRDRATSLRAQADHLGPLLDATYRRRASELEMEAWLLEVQSGLPYDQVVAAA